MVTAGVLFLALIPAPPTVTGLLGWDKLNHAAAMAVVACLATCSVRPALWAVAFGGGYAMLLGILIELLQGAFTTTRSAEWGDLAADAVGVAVAMLGMKLWKRKNNFE